MASSSSTGLSSGVMTDITVKTLDGKNRTFSVPDNLTIRQFKEKISGSIEISADTQRLIFQGRVMQDEKLVKDYDIHGKVIHVVQRAPPSTLSGAAASSATSSSTSNAGQRTSQGHPPGRHGHFIHVGRVQQPAPSSREARARLRQAEFNLEIINDALHLLESRTGFTGDPEDSNAQPAPSETNMDTSTSPPATAEATSTTTPASTGTQPSDSTDQQQTGSTSDTANGSAGNRAQDNTLSATELADFLDRVLQTNSRVVPHLQRYRNYLRSEETYPESSRAQTDAQEVVNRVNEVLHAMSHVMHSLSDVMVDMGVQHPRQVVAHSPSPFPMPGGATSMTIPIHMNILPRNAANQSQQPPNSQTSTAAATTSSESTTSQTSATTQSATVTSTANAPNTANGGRTSAMLGPFTFPLGSVPLPGLGNGATGSVIVEAMANIDTMVGSEMEGSSEDSNDSSTVETTVTIESSSVPENQSRPQGNGSSTNQGTRPTATTTSSGQTLSGQFGNIPGATSTFSIGPTTNVNLLPNVPGLPRGVMQSINSILQSQGIPHNQPIQVNIVRQSAPVTIVGQSAPPGQQRQYVPYMPMANNSASGHTNDASQQATPATNEVGTGTSNNAATNTSGSTEASTNTSRTATASSATATTNTTVGGTNGPTSLNGSNRTSSVGTATNPGPGTNSRSTNTARFQAPNPFNVPHHHHHHHPHNPAAASGPPPGSVYADPFLFCNSHNYHTQSARTAFRNLQQNAGRGRGHGIRPQQQQVPNLSTMVSGMVGNIIDQVGAAYFSTAFNNGFRPGSSSAPSSNTGPSSTTNTSNAATTATSAPNTGTTSASPSSNGAPPPPFNPMQMLAGMFGGSAGQSGGGGQTGQGGQLPFNLESVVGNLMQAARPGGSGSSTQQGSAPTGGTLADMFTYFRPQGESNDEAAENPNVLVSLLENIAPHMGLADLFSLVMGNTRVISQLRAPLRQFVEERLAVAGSVDALVTSALDDMFPEIQHIQGLVQVRAGVDMASSVRSCLKTHLTTLFSVINSDTPAGAEEFGSNLYSLWMAMMAETIALCIYCIQDGQAGFSSMVQRYMPRMTQGMNPAITIWMTTSLQSILASFHRNHPVPESQIMRYVVRTGDSTATTATLTSAPSVTVSGDSRSSSGPNNTSTNAQSPMDVSGESPSSQPPKAKAARTEPDEEDNSGEIFEDALETVAPSQGQGRQIATARASANHRPKPVTSTPTARGVAATTNTRGVVRNGNRSTPDSTDNWQSVIPQEWIPVITQDITRQQLQRQQPPMSDAYLQGLPAKRRRTMHTDHAGEMGSMGLYLPSALSRAARVAGVEPISSQENMAEEAADNAELQTELEREVTAVLESRITSDTDFSSDRFPNAKEYFHKSKRH